MLGRYHYSILKINSDKNKLDDDFTDYKNNLKKLDIISIDNSESLEIAYNKVINKMKSLGLSLAISIVGFDNYTGFMIAFRGNSSWSCGLYVSYGNGFNFCRIENGRYISNTINVS